MVQLSRLSILEQRLHRPFEVPYQPHDTASHTLQQPTNHSVQQAADHQNHASDLFSNFASTRHCTLHSFPVRFPMISLLLPHSAFQMKTRRLFHWRSMHASKRFPCRPPPTHIVPLCYIMSRPEERLLDRMSGLGGRKASIDRDFLLFIRVNVETRLGLVLRVRCVERVYICIRVKSR